MALWISHRGESADAPENTMPAFQLAAERNTDGTETDIHLTADGVLVCCHDSDTWRTCQGVRNVIERTSLADLRQLDASGSRSGFGCVPIPLFSESLQTIGNRLFYVEIKENDPAVIDAMQEQIRLFSLRQEQIVMISFHAEIVRLYKEKFPEQKAYWLFSYGDVTEENLDSATGQFIARLKDLHADGADLHLSGDLISPQLVQKYHDAGFEVAVWTVDQREDALRWLSAGADAITSNCAAKLRDSIQK